MTTPSPLQKKKRAFWSMSCVALLTLHGCGSDDDQFRWAAEKAVQSHLKDPDSAKFERTFVIRAEPDERGYSKLAACGVVNGKNSYGAYSGDVRFVAWGSQGPGMQDIASVNVENPFERSATVGSRETKNPATVFEQVYWNTHCVDATHQPSYTAKVD